MKIESPTFVCDSCNRPLGLSREQTEKEHMAQFPLHFCNNNCKDTYQDQNKFDQQIYWLSMDWPKVTASLR